MKPSNILIALFLLCASGIFGTEKTNEAHLTFCCAEDNDLYAALKQYHFPRFSSPNDAIQRASEGSGVLLLADRYPDQTVYLEPAEFALIKKKNLRVFIEYPSALPGLETASTPHTANWERIVVTSDWFGADLPKMSILAAHECRFRPVIGSPKADLVIARVAAEHKLGAARQLRFLPAPQFSLERCGTRGCWCRAEFNWHRLGYSVFCLDEL